MITVDASQKSFTCAGVTTLTDIRAEHQQDLTKRHRLGSISRTGILKSHGEQWLFMSHDSRLNPVNGLLAP
jgi:hypothetical protein